MKVRAWRVTRATLSFAVLATTPIVAQQRPQNRVALEQYLDWEEVRTHNRRPTAQRSSSAAAGSTR